MHIPALAFTLFSFLVISPICAQTQFDLWEFDRITERNRKLLDLPDEGIFNPDWSSEGEMIIFDVVRSDMTQSLAILSVNTPPFTTVYDYTGIDCGNNASFNRETTYFIFDRAPCGLTNIYRSPIPRGPDELYISDAIDPQYNKRVGRPLISYTRPSENMIYVYNFETDTEYPIAIGATAKWNPAGTALVFARTGNLYKVGISGSGAPIGSPQQLTFSASISEDRPDFLGSNEVVYSSNTSGQYDLKSIHTISGAMNLITSLPPGNHFDPDFHNGLDKIAYSSDRTPCQMDCGSSRYTIVMPCSENYIEATDFFNPGDTCPGLSVQVKTFDGRPVPNPVTENFFCQDLIAVISNSEGTECTRRFRLEAVNMAITPKYVGVTWGEYWRNEIPANFIACGEVEVSYEDFTFYEGCDLYRFKRVYQITDACGNTSTLTQFIDIVDHFLCELIGPRQIPSGNQFWVRIDLPEHTSVKNLEWTVAGEKWEIIKTDKTSALIKAGSGKAKIAAHRKNDWGVNQMVEDIFNAYSEKTFSKGRIDGSDNIAVFPNPASDFIYITRNNNPTHIKIINANGQVVRSVVWDNLESPGFNQISVKELPSGIYFLTVQGHDLSKTSRFIKK